MIYGNPLRLVRQLKGAPLSCLVTLSLVQQPVTARFLGAVTGYGTQAITSALEALEVLGYAACNKRRSAWRLLDGVQLLPLGSALLDPLDRENHDQSLEEDSIDLKEFTLSLDLRPDRENHDPEKGDLDPERILEATGLLFGERVFRLPGAVDSVQMLACIAEAYDKRHKLAHPARLAYRNLTRGNRPDERYQDYRSYLPDSFLAACGLLPAPPAPGAGSPDPSPEPEPDPEDPGPDLGAGPLPAREPDPSLLLPAGDGRLTAQVAWRTALAQVQLQVPRGAYAEYVEPAWLCRYDPLGRVFTAAAPNGYARDWLEGRLSSTLTRLLTGICNQTVSVCFTLEEPR